MSSRLDQAATVAVILTALVVSASFVRGDGDSVSRPRFVEDWRDLAEIGIRVGDSTAPIKLIEFADFECSFCARYHEPVVRLRTEFGSDLEFVLIHSPLPQHKFAVDAGRAAECAHRQDRFSEFESVTYAKQDSLGVLPWSVLAARANVPSLDAFDQCLSDSSSLARVDSGRAVSARLQIPGTPTFVVNGHLITGGGPDTLRALIVNELRRARRIK